MIWAARLLSAGTLFGAILLIPNLLALDRVQLANWFGLVVGGGFLAGALDPGERLSPDQRRFTRIVCACAAAACFATSGLGWIAGTSYYAH